MHSRALTRPFTPRVPSVLCGPTTSAYCNRPLEAHCITFSTECGCTRSLISLDSRPTSLTTSRPRSRNRIVFHSGLVRSVYYGPFNRGVITLPVSKFCSILTHHYSALLPSFPIHGRLPPLLTNRRDLCHSRFHARDEFLAS